MAKIIEKIGVIALIVGLVIAFIISLFYTELSATAIVILGILGVIVGLVNVTDEEVMHYLLASLVFVVSASALQDLVGVVPVVGGWAATFLNSVIVLVAPAAAIVSLRALYEVAREK